MANPNDKILIGITQIVDHPSLNEAKRGVIQALADSGYKEGDNLTIIAESAQGNITLSTQIAQKLVSLSPNLIIPISTPSAQTIFAKAGGKIPIIFSTVTDPVTAGLVKDLAHNNEMITGVTDSPPIAECINLIKNFVPSIKKLGIIYNPGESNSANEVKFIKKQVGSDMEIVEATANDSANVAESIKSLVGEVDAIYLPADNTVWAAMKPLLKIAYEHRIPVISSDPDSVKQGVLAAIGYSQYDVGYKAGKIAGLVLAKKESISNIKVSTAENYTIAVNKKSMSKLGLELPQILVNKKIDLID